MIIALELWVVPSTGDGALVDGCNTGGKVFRMFLRNLVIKGLFIEIAAIVVVGVLNASPQFVRHFSCGPWRVALVQSADVPVTLMGHLILVEFLRHV